MKLCRKCREMKELSEFYAMSRAKDGRQSKCKECERVYKTKNAERLRNYHVERYRDNREADLARSGRYRMENREQIAAQRKTYREQNKKTVREGKKRDYWKHREAYIARAKAHYQKNTEARKKQVREWERRNRARSNRGKREHERRKLAIDPAFKINRGMARSIKLSLAGKKGGIHWEQLVNYTCRQLIEHLEKLFHPGMTWENHGEWHIDHIVPQSWFSFDSPTDEQFRQCWALENLQPMWASDNLRKGNRYVA